MYPWGHPKIDSEIHLAWILRQSKLRPAQKPIQFMTLYLRQKEYVQVSIIVLISLLVYSPSLTTYWYADNIHWFITLVESLNEQKLVQWLLTSHNGHLETLPRFGYWVLYQFLDRDVVIWHIISVSVWIISLYCVYLFLANIFSDRKTNLFLLFLFAVSPAYQEILLGAFAAMNLWCYLFMLGSLVLLQQYLKFSHLVLYLLSIIMGFAAAFCAAFGILVLPFHILLTVLYSQRKRERFITILGGVFGSICLFAIYMQFVGQGSNFDPLF
ncbi:MAG: hypothetical protein R3A44_05895 [Caldilineaceae bacterium]